MKSRPALFAVLLMAFAAAGCTAAGAVATEAIGEGFAIYLLSEEHLMDDVQDLSQVQLPEIALLSSDDILAYNSNNHVLDLAPSVSELLDALELPGRPFVVAVDREPIYAGAFMAAYFSRSYDGVVILWPPMNGEANTLTIQLGYPTEDFFAGDDPRSEARILEALHQADKLR